MKWVEVKSDTVVDGGFYYLLCFKDLKTDEETLELVYISESNAKFIVDFLGIGSKVNKAVTRYIKIIK